MYHLLYILSRLFQLALLFATVVTLSFIVLTLGLFVVLAYCSTGDDHLIGKSVLVPRPAPRGCGVFQLGERGGRDVV